MAGNWVIKSKLFEHSGELPFERGKRMLVEIVDEIDNDAKMRMVAYNQIVDKLLPKLEKLISFQNV